MLFLVWIRGMDGSPLLPIFIPQGEYKEHIIVKEVWDTMREFHKMIENFTSIIVINYLGPDASTPRENSDDQNVENLRVLEKVKLPKSKRNHKGWIN